MCFDWTKSHVLFFLKIIIRQGRVGTVKKIKKGLVGFDNICFYEYNK